MYQLLPIASHPIATHLWEEFGSIVAVSSDQVAVESHISPSLPSIVISASSLRSHSPAPPQPPWWPPLGSPLDVNAFLLMGRPNLEASLQVQFHKCPPERTHSSPWRAGCALANTAQVALPYCEEPRLLRPSLSGLIQQRWPPTGLQRPKEVSGRFYLQHGGQCCWGRA